MKDRIFEEIDKIKSEIMQLSKNIYDNPELGFEEYKSAEFIKDMLRKHGFTIEDKSGGLDTAFKARFRGNGPGGTVAFLAEYDALPGMGHGCGHHLIAAISAGAVIGLSKFMKELGGEIVLMGTPAEEGGGGKIKLLEKGEFDDIDYSLMCHPSTANIINKTNLATTKVKITYTGLPAHSSAPEKGINALQAVIQTFNLIDSSRTIMPFKSNINGIITSGGATLGIIPDYAQCEFSVRSATLTDLKTMVNMVKNIVKSVEQFTGAKGEVTTGIVYADRHPNHVIGELFKKYMEEQGEVVNYPDPNEKLGSSDIGNVSLKMPTVQTHVKITDERLSLHTKEFAAASVTDRAYESAIKAAKSLACAGYEILTDEKVRQEIKKDFGERVSANLSTNFAD